MAEAEGGNKLHCQLNIINIRKDTILKCCSTVCKAIGSHEWFQSEHSSLLMLAKIIIYAMWIDCVYQSAVFVIASGGTAIVSGHHIWHTPSCEPSVNGVETTPIRHKLAPRCSGFGAHPTFPENTATQKSDIWLSPPVTAPVKMRTRCSTVKLWQGCRAEAHWADKTQFARFLTRPRN